MRNLSVLAFTLMTLGAFSQEKSAKVSTHNEDEKVFTKIEVESGPENLAQWKDYLRKSTRLSASTFKELKPGQYELSIKFVVNTHGSIGQVTALPGAPAVLATKAIAIFKNYPGNWRPANQCGRAVNSYQQMKLVFELN